MRPGFPLFLCAALAAPGLRAAIPVGLSASASWVDNISRTSDAATSRDGARYEATLTADLNRQFARDWFLNAGLDLRSGTVPDFDRNNALELGPRARVRRKFGLGPFAPSASAAAGLAYRATGLAGDDGWLATAELRAAKRLTETLRLALSGGWLEQYAGHSTFDIRQQTARIELGWDVSERWSLTVSHGRLWGDLVANASGPVYASALAGGLGPAVQDYYNRIAFETSHAYGPGWVSYRVHARADVWSASLNRAFWDRASAELRVDGAAVRSQVGVRYETDSYSLSLALRF